MTMFINNYKFVLAFYISPLFCIQLYDQTLTILSLILLVLLHIAEIIKRVHLSLGDSARKCGDQGTIQHNTPLNTLTFTTNCMELL